MSVTLLLAAAINMQCVETQINSGNQQQTLEEIRELCKQREEGKIERTDVAESSQDKAVDKRLKAEILYNDNPFGILSHYNNYILLGSYNDTPNYDSWVYDDKGPSPWEIKFQISMKVPLTSHWFGDKSGLFMAYTNQSWWQAYNSDVSAPFRDTNHMPELLWIHKFDERDFWGWNFRYASFALNHQSNGRSGERSRSWNRVIGSALVDKGPVTLGARVWHRLHESKKDGPDDTKGDDNPDITDYMGHGEIFAVYAYDDHNITMRARGNINEHKGGFEAGWSFPIKGKLRGYLQGYWGYGENLLDYNHKNNRLSVGVEITPIL